MKKTAYFLLGLSFVLLIVSLSWFFFGDLERKEMYASVNVTDGIGFDLNGTALTFGNVPRPGSSSRNIIFKNDYDFPVLLMVGSSGDINELLSYDKKTIVEPGEEKKIPFLVSTELSTPSGLYSGKVEFRVRPSKY